MRRRLFASAIIALVMVAPTAAAQSLEEQLQDFHFKRLVFTFVWNEEQDRAQMVVTAEDLGIDGEGASDLRRCIDGGECPMPFPSNGDNDGDVSQHEVEAFQEDLRFGLSQLDEVKEIQRNIRGLVRVDNLNATSSTLAGLDLREATGSVESRDTIHIYVTITASYATVKPADFHKVTMQRTQSTLTLADQIVVQAGKNWRIVEDSIEPAAMQQFYSKGRLAGTQEEFESTEPLVYNVEYHKSSAGGWVLWLSLAGILAAAAGVGVFLLRRKV